MLGLTELLLLFFRNTFQQLLQLAASFVFEFLHEKLPTHDSYTTAVLDLLRDILSCVPHSHRQ